MKVQIIENIKEIGKPVICYGSAHNLMLFKTLLATVSQFLQYYRYRYHNRRWSSQANIDWDQCQIIFAYQQDREDGVWVNKIRPGFFILLQIL
jgi:hypothetical protein